MSATSIFTQAVKMTETAMKNNDVESIIREAFSSIQNPTHWKNEAYTFTHDRSEAVRNAAAFVFFHGGAVVKESNRDGKKIFIVGSEGYYKYTSA